MWQSLNDGTPEVRDAAFSALAGIAKVQLLSCFVGLNLGNVMSDDGAVYCYCVVMLHFFYADGWNAPT